MRIADGWALIAFTLLRLLLIQVQSHAFLAAAYARLGKQVEALREHTIIDRLSSGGSAVARFAFVAAAGPTTASRLAE